jgi:DNA topoisomerase-1
MTMTTTDELAGCGLVFGSDEEPGIRRRGPRRPRYYDEASGREIRDADTLQRIRSLVVPPAWVDVWISRDPDSHVQATGRDARGRKQYRYHPGFRAHREATKFDQLVPFGQVLAGVRRAVDHDLRRHGLPRERVTALVVALLDRTALRVGNEEYAKENGTYGLTTLRDRHASIDGAHLRIHFTGKSSKVHDVHWKDARLATLVQRCQDLPGQLLFQWVDEEGEQHPLVSDDVNVYLRTASGFDVTAKTFRTWAATTHAASVLSGIDCSGTVAERKRCIRRAIIEVAAELGNTPTVCRASYVHPEVLDSFQAGEFNERWQAASARGSSRLTLDERRLLHFLADGKA